MWFDTGIELHLWIVDFRSCRTHSYLQERNIPTPPFGNISRRPFSTLAVSGNVEPVQYEPISCLTKLEVARFSVFSAFTISPALSFPVGALPLWPESHFSSGETLLHGL